MLESNTSIYRWKNRLITIEVGNKKALQHFEILKKKNAADWDDYKLKIVSLEISEFKKIAKSGALSLLVGLDGTVKVAYEELPDFTEIASKIDTMSMRKEEVLLKSQD